MQKITFQDYPNTTTPLNASNMNTLQTNVESAINSGDTTLQTQIDDLKGEVLYENSTGSSSTITLSESVDDYTYLEIFYINGALMNSKKVKLIEDGVFSLEAEYKSGTTLYHTMAKYTVSGTSLTPVSSDCGYWSLTGTTITLNYDGINYSNITQVIGYK